MSRWSPYRCSGPCASCGRCAPFRVLGASRALLALARSLSGVRRILFGHGLHFVLAAALLIVVVAGALITAVEHDHADATIRDLSDGLWWAMTTVTTVGYGDTYPKTDIGRGIGVALMLLGISLFGVITANVAAFFVEEREDEVLTEVRALRRELRERAESMDLH